TFYFSQTEPLDFLFFEVNFMNFLLPNFPNYETVLFTDGSKDSDTAEFDPIHRSVDYRKMFFFFSKNQSY
ncbi:MAG: hypothetical protein AB2695_17795, partial [Candidatus Thiodiazotropha endolucinida]